MIFGTVKEPDAPRTSAAMNDRKCPESGQGRLMSKMVRIPISRPLVLSVTLVCLVFVVDLLLPLGVASAVPYTFAVLLALRARIAARTQSASYRNPHRYD